jgi:hypothetical protein
MAECIFSTDNTLLVLQIKGLFDTNEIHYYIQNLNTPNIYGDSKLTTGMNLLTGPMKIYVDSEDKKAALDLIKIVSPESKRYKKTGKKTCNESKYDDMVILNSMIIKSLVLSSASCLITPLFFNIGYFDKIFKHKKLTAIILISICIVNTIIGMVLLINNTQNMIFLNILILPVLCLGKFISLRKKTKSKLCFLLLIPVIIGIIIILRELPNQFW